MIKTEAKEINVKDLQLMELPFPYEVSIIDRVKTPLGNWE